MNSLIAHQRRILIISNTSWNLFNFRLPLMSWLKDEGYEVVAVAPFDKYSGRLNEAGFRYIDLPMNNKGTNPIQDIGLAMCLLKLFRSERPDVVLTYTPKPNIYASIVGGLSRTQVIPNISGLGNAFIRKSLVTTVVKFLYRLALRFPAKVFFQNNDDMNFFAHLGLIKEGIAERIPGSGINTTKFSPLTAAQEKDGSFIFLLVARMLWDKGVGEFVEAARLLKKNHAHVRFQLLGFLDVENPQAISRLQVDQWVDEGVIEYLGETDHVIDVMRKSDCVVLPSYREGLPRTLLEAGSLAKPIVASDVPGCRDVVDQGVTGYLCKVKNVSDLANKMKKVLLLSQSDRLSMGALGREKVIRQFDEKIILDKYVQVIDSMLKPSV